MAIAPRFHPRIVPTRAIPKSWMVMGIPVGIGMEIWEITVRTAAYTPMRTRLWVEMLRLLSDVREVEDTVLIK